MNKSVNYLFILLQIFALACSTSNEKKEQERRLEESYSHAKIGVALLEAGNYPSALNQLLRAYELNPTDVGILNNLGLAYHYRGRSDLGIQKLQQAIKLQPAYTDARVNLGRVYIESNKYAQALIPLIEASKDLTYPFPEKTHSNLGEAYFYLNDYKEAQKQFATALQSNRDYCPALFMNTKTLFQMGQYFRSSKSADQSISKCTSRTPPPYIPELYYLSAMSYLFQNDNSAAKDRFRQLKLLYPNDSFTEKSKKALEELEK